MNLGVGSIRSTQTALRETVIEQRSMGRTVLFSTHVMAQAETICDFVCIVAGGEKVLEGRVSDLLRASGNETKVRVQFASTEDSSAQSLLSDSSWVASMLPKSEGLFELTLALGVKPENILSRLIEVGAQVRRFQPVTPSLHDIFISSVSIANAARDDHAASGKTI